MKRQLFLIDDHPVFREGLVYLLKQESDLAICGEAASTAEAIYLLGQLKPDLLLVDLSLKDGSGLDLISRATAEHGPMKMLVLTAHDEGQYAAEALRRGAMGFIMKDESRPTLLKAIRQVLRGEIYVSPLMTPRIVSRLIKGEESPLESVERVLSRRELEIFQLIGRGLETQQIADSLGLSPKTIRVHRDNMRRKLKVETTQQLHQLAFEWLGRRL